MGASIHYYYALHSEKLHTAERKRRQGGGERRPSETMGRSDIGTLLSLSLRFRPLTNRRRYASECGTEKIKKYQGGGDGMGRR